MIIYFNYVSKGLIQLWQLCLGCILYYFYANIPRSAFQLMLARVCLWPLLLSAKAAFLYLTHIVIFEFLKLNESFVQLPLQL